MTRKLLLLLLIPCGLLFASWGSQGHRKISANSASCYPPPLGFLMPSWSVFVTNHASDADIRKNTDPNESPKHYLDIDNYPEFIQSGMIGQYYDSVVAVHGGGWVLDQGILPWATLTSYDSLKACFERGDWNRSAYFAADLGHYVADGHMPLHITRNYNGQYSNQTGVHSRYESKMIYRFDAQIVYPADTAVFVDDVRSYIFGYLYLNYRCVDSVLYADSAATASAGSITSDAYYQALWDASRPFTLRLYRDASHAIASLIYTAWVEAGSPMLYPNAIGDPEGMPRSRLYPNFPNPCEKETVIPLEISGDQAIVSVKVYDGLGVLRTTLVDGRLTPGRHEIRWNTDGLSGGVYHCVMRTGSQVSSLKIVVEGNDH